MRLGCGYPQVTEVLVWWDNVHPDKTWRSSLTGVGVGGTAWGHAKWSSDPELSGRERSGQERERREDLLLLLLLLFAARTESREYWSGLDDDAWSRQCRRRRIRRAHRYRDT
jgi:hypothetical protein